MLRAKYRATTPLPAIAVFVAYADVAAARDALDRVRDMFESKRMACRLQPMLWRFDQLDAPRWREMALADATRAFAIVLALSRTEPLCPAADAWLTALAERQNETPIRVLAFTTDDEPWSISLQRVQTSARTTSRALAA
jgi:hypothetical protein